jgi:hypothetical protein
MRRVMQRVPVEHAYAAGGNGGGLSRRFGPRRVAERGDHAQAQDERGADMQKYEGRERAAQHAPW